ncbi:hypothetical protein AA0120_g8233 [Alternaria tenuissima]|jgi:hypothetical protein|nr:hypothetical protein AA0120_g8233 [Alternaria tenuissima]
MMSHLLITNKGVNERCGAAAQDAQSQILYGKRPAVWIPDQDETETADKQPQAPTDC